MARAAAPRNIPLALRIVCGLILAGIIAAIIYLNAPTRKLTTTLTPEANAYVSHLVLSDVSQSAAENLLKQQVVEIRGKISNRGPRALKSVDVYCIFYGVDGQVVHQERAQIVSPKSGSFEPNQTRPFRLAFDTLPGAWNQAMPKLVIAQIKFAQ